MCIFSPFFVFIGRLNDNGTTESGKISSGADKNPTFVKETLFAPFDISGFTLKEGEFHALLR